MRSSRPNPLTSPLIRAFLLGLVLPAAVVESAGEPGTPTKGGSYFDSSTGGEHLSGQQTGTSTTLTSSINPSSFNQSTTLTATVVAVGQAFGTPSGPVTFMDGATTLGTGALDGSGVTTLATSSLTVGSHTLTAVYGGDTNFATSTSAPLTQIVNAEKQATVTTCNSSSNPSSRSATIRFTGHLILYQSATRGSKIDSAGVGLDYPLPTGTVTFYDGVTLLGTQTLSSSLEATLTISSLAVGSHAITAAYSGDDNYSGSTSDVLTQIVTPGEEVPTLSTWGLVALVGALGAAGAFLLGRGLLAG